MAPKIRVHRNPNLDSKGVFQFLKMASSSNDEWLKGLGLGKRCHFLCSILFPTFFSRARTRGQIKETGDDSVWLTSLEVVDNFRRSVSAHDKRRRQPKEETLEPAPSSEIGAEDKTTTSPGAAEESSVQTADRTEAAEGASLANFDAPVSEKAKKKRGKAKRKSSEKEPTEQPMADSPKVPIVAAPSPVPECGEGEEESGVNPVVVQQKTAKEKKSAKKKRRDQVEVLPGDMQNPSGQLPAPTAKVVSPPQAAVQQPEEEPKAPSAKEAAEQPRRRSRSDLAVISQAKLEDLEEDEGEGDEGGAHRRKRSLRSGRKSGNEATKEEEEAPEAEVAAVAASVSSGAGQPPQPRRSGGGGSTASGGGGARRKKENAGGGNASSSNAGGAGEVQDPWVLCDKCKKWRKLPSHVSLVHLPKRWFCHMNEWDAKRSNCDAEEVCPNPHPNSLSSLPFFQHTKRREKIFYNHPFC